LKGNFNKNYQLPFERLYGGAKCKSNIPGKCPSEGEMRIFLNRWDA
jgi:hypothetical protein